MYIYIKMRYQDEMWLNVNRRYAQLSLAEVGRCVLNMKIADLGFVTVHLDLQVLFANDLSVQQIHVNMEEPVWEVKLDLDSYVFARWEEEEHFVKMVSIH